MLMSTVTFVCKKNRSPTFVRWLSILKSALLSLFRTKHTSKFSTMMEYLGNNRIDKLLKFLLANVVQWKMMAESTWILRFLQVSLKFEDEIPKRPIYNPGKNFVVFLVKILRGIYYLSQFRIEEIDHKYNGLI